MKNFLLASVFLIAVFSFNDVKADRQAKIDSLEKVLKIVDSDTDRVNTLYLLSDELSDIKPELSIEYGNQGLVLAKRISFKRGISKCLNSLGNAYSSLGDYKKAIGFFEERFKIVTELKDSMGIAAVYDNIAVAFIHFGNNDTALYLREQAMKIYSFLKKENYLANGHLWIGNIQKDKGNYPDALNNYLNALKTYEKLNDTISIAFALVNISSIHRFMKDFKQAKQYAFNARDLFASARYERGVGMSFYRLALTYKDEEELDSAIHFLFNARAVFTELKDEYFLTVIANMLGNAFQQVGKKDDALTFYQDGLKLAVEHDDKNAKAIALSGIGTLMMEKKKYQEAERYLHETYDLLIEVGDKENVKNLSAHFIELYSKMNKPDSTLKYFQLYKQYSDSLFDTQKTAAIAEMKEKYDTEKKEGRIRLLTQEKKLNEQEISKQKFLKFTFISAAVILLLIISLVISNQREKLRVNRLMQQNETREKISKDLHDALSEGISFIERRTSEFNFSILPESDKERVYSIKNKSQDLRSGMKEVVWALDPDNDNLFSLLSYLRHYATSYLEKEKKNLNISFPEKIPDMSLKPGLNRNIFLITKEALNNIIKYSSASLINLEFMLYDKNHFSFSIIDNGKGFNPDNISVNNNGIRNMKKRMQEMDGEISINSQEGNGCTIIISGKLS